MPAAKPVAASATLAACPAAPCAGKNCVPRTDAVAPIPALCTPDIPCLHVPGNLGARDQRESSRGRRFPNRRRCLALFRHNRRCSDGVVTTAAVRETNFLTERGFCYRTRIVTVGVFGALSKSPGQASPRPHRLLTERELAGDGGVIEVHPCVLGVQPD